MIFLTHELRRISLVLVVIALIAGCNGASVLHRIETYKAPPYPVSEELDRETYDYRVKNGKPVPPTFTDALICDLWQRMTMDLDIKGINQHSVSENDVERAINIYLDKDWQEIAGYRPWTHSNFLRGLNESERKKLAAEVVRYMSKYGVRKSSSNE